MVGLDHFCRVLFEDESKNAMIEDIEVWSKIVNSKWFSRKYCKMVLILNKTDIFYECLKYISLNICFGDEYKGEVIPHRYNLNYFPNNLSRKVFCPWQFLQTATRFSLSFDPPLNKCNTIFVHQLQIVSLNQ